MEDLFKSKAAKNSKKKIPYEFVLAHLSSLNIRTKPMFGALAIYQGEKILFILREKESNLEDNGVWVATIHEHHTSLRSAFPNLRSIRIFGQKESSWQNLPAESADFEEAVARLCELALLGDLRIGKVPDAKKKKFAATTAKKKLTKKQPAKKTKAKKAAPKKTVAKKSQKAKKKATKKK